MFGNKAKMNENLGADVVFIFYWNHSLLKKPEHKISIYRRGLEDHYWDNFDCIAVSPSLQTRSIIIEEWAITKLFSYQI